MALSGVCAVLAQEQAQLSGKIRDSVQAPVPNTNIIAKPLSESHQITFAISGKNGGYQLRLDKGVPYAIAIMHLGYSDIHDTLTITADRIKDYTLHPGYENLEQVVIRAKMAMIVKKDTITYRVDKFETGNERKLRDILKKLPGVEVDREGNVTVNGKRVTKLMVDGKDFFGGNTKLGVNNIPADAVEEVEAIDDYHEVAFMKGLSDSDKLALNIKLKEGKKKFVFGENEAGGGIKERYFIHPTLFYYSPNTTVNFIGSLNNTNDSPLDWQDVIRFKGGFGSFLNNPIRSGDVGLTQFSSSRDMRFHKTIFGAANLNQGLTKALRLEAYSILSQQKSRAKVVNRTQYLTQDDFVENRKTTGEDKGFGSFNKIRLRYRPSIKKDMAYDLIINSTNSHSGQYIRSQIADSTNLTNTLSDPHNLEISQYFRYSTRPTYEHTSEVKANYTYKESNALTEWDFDRPVFPDIIPALPDGGRYDFLHDYSSVTNTGKVNFKHYWVLNNTNHLYPLAGIYFYHQTYHSADFQRLRDASINPFHDAGFGNAVSYQLIDPYIGFQYKFMLGKDLIFRPGLVYHHYFWFVDQFDKRITDQDKSAFLPEFMAKYEISSTQKLELNYHLKSTFAEAEDYANRLRLTGFNSLFRGNEDLENSLYHSLNLSYRTFNVGRGTNYSLGIGYTHRAKSVQRTSMLEGINQVITEIYTESPENRYQFSGNFNKRWKNYAFGVSGSASLSNYARIINQNKLDYDAQAYRLGISARTIYQEWPNITVGLSQSFRNSKSDRSTDRYWAFEPSLQVDYDFLKGFILKAYYRYSHTKDSSTDQGQAFQIGSVSLYYSKESSPWGFEIRVKNIFDAAYKRTHYLNEFMVYDIRTYIQPRTALFILSYRL